MKKYFLLIIILFISCSDDKDLSKQGSVDESYNRVVMMENLTDNIIIPSLENLDSKLKAFNTSLSSFSSDTSLDNLSALRSDFLEAYKAWQHVEMFNIGKAEEIYYNLKSNVYPVNVARIMANMDNPNLDLDDCSDTKPNNCSAQGFPTLDYLLYGIGDNDDSILLEYKNESVNFKEYLNTVAQKLTSNTSIVLDDLKLNKDNFISSTDNTMTSNLNMLINDFVYYYEKGLRTNKFGIPGGVFSSYALPDRVEGYYSKKYSKELSLEAFSSIKNFFNGISHENKDISGTGLKSYLDFLDPNKTQLLSDEINNQFNIAENSINELNNNFSEQTSTGLLKLLTTYDNIQKAVVLLKVDMLQILNINVDYVDADGD